MDKLIQELHLELVAQEAYGVIEWLSDGKWLHQDEFDRRASDSFTALRPMKLLPLNSKSLIPPLGMAQNHLFALLIMVGAGKVEQKGKDGSIEYRWIEQKN